MARPSKKPPTSVLPIPFIDECDVGLGRIMAVAELLSLVDQVRDPACLRDGTISRAALLMDSEAARLRTLLRQQGK